MPEPEHADAASWLLIGTTATADVLASTLADTLKNHGAQCTTMAWPQQADHTAHAEQLRNQWRGDGFTGVVVLTGPKTVITTRSRHCSAGTMCNIWCGSPAS